MYLVIDFKILNSNKIVCQLNLLIHLESFSHPFLNRLIAADVRPSKKIN